MRLQLRRATLFGQFLASGLTFAMAAQAWAQGSVPASQNSAPSQTANSNPSTGQGPVSQIVAEPSADAVTTADTVKLMVKPGQSISVNMATEDIICTNDVAVATLQRDHFPDSAEASFILAVALSRTSRFEDALKEVRRARRLAEKDGGPAYFDKMIATYEKMLTYYPDDNQVRYHLAWAYYMKAYLLAHYSQPKAGQQPKYKEWVQAASHQSQAQAQQQAPAATTASAGATTAAAVSSEKSSDAEPNVMNSLGHIQKTMSQASPDMVPQIKQYYALALGKLDDLLVREPSDVWARVYRAHLQAEASGDLDSAMAEWQKVKESSPGNPAPYFFLGEGYLKKGNLRECMTHVSKAVALRTIGN
jgi:tetratricopeptide (TPR) repeat protein